MHSVICDDENRLVILYTEGSTGMSPDTPPAQGYPDFAANSLIRVGDIGFLEFTIRMTVAPGERFVKLWELEAGVPVHWFGNVFRIHVDPPGLYLNYKYERALDRFQRDQLARLAAKFWAS